MKKLMIIFVMLGLAACTFPHKPTEGSLLNGAKQYRPEMLESGARGVVIVSMTDNVSKDGFFGKNYENVVAFKNMQSGEIYHLKTKLDSRAYDTAMLPIGDYQVTNLYLQYVYTTTQQSGNTTITRTHVETVEHFEGNKKITFKVKPGAVTYIGNIELVKSENKVNADGTHPVNTFKIEDRSAKIPQKQKTKWENEFGQSYVVNIAKAQ